MKKRSKIEKRKKKERKFSFISFQSLLSLLVKFVETIIFEGLTFMMNAFPISLQK